MVVWCPGAIVTQKKSRCCQITARTATSADDVMCTKRTFPQAPIRGLAGAHARKQDPHRTHRLLPSPPRKKQGLAPSHLTFRILRQTFSAEHPDCILTQTRFVLLRSLRHCDAAISLPSSYPSPLPPLASRHVMSPRLSRLRTAWHRSLGAQQLLLASIQYGHSEATSPTRQLSLAVGHGDRSPWLNSAERTWLRLRYSAHLGPVWKRAERRSTKINMTLIAIRYTLSSATSPPTK